MYEDLYSSWNLSYLKTLQLSYCLNIFKDIRERSLINDFFLLKEITRQVQCNPVEEFDMFETCDCVKRTTESNVVVQHFYHFSCCQIAGNIVEFSIQNMGQDKKTTTAKQIAMQINTRLPRYAYSPVKNQLMHQSFVSTAPMGPGISGT